MCERLRAAGRSGRTVVIKVRRYDFSTLTRSETLRGPTDDPGVVREAAARLMEGVDTTAGVRLLGVGVTGLADYTQEDLFAQAAQAAHEAPSERTRRRRPAEPPERGGGRGAPEGPGTPDTAAALAAGLDVRHAEYGAGWVQGSGVGRVTVRFEAPWSRARPGADVRRRRSGAGAGRAAALAEPAGGSRMSPGWSGGAGRTPAGRRCGTTRLAGAGSRQAARGA